MHSYSESCFTLQISQESQLMPVEYAQGQVFGTLSTLKRPRRNVPAKTASVGWFRVFGD